MGLLNFFKKTKSKPESNSSYAEAMTHLHGEYNAKVAAVESGTNYLSNEAMQEIFAEYFAPNIEFYSQPDSPQYIAYFSAINAATLEMLNNKQLYRQATKRDWQELAAMLQNRVPGVTNSIICGLIFSMGKYAVVPDIVLCVDFAETIPNCIAIYLLLTAQKKPADRRTQIIDAGDGADKQPLTRAMNNLNVCDLNWKYQIH
jgi:hypothetical protein